MRWLTLVLLGLLAAVQTDLWFGRASLPHVMQLRGELASVQAGNDAASARNQRTQAEVADLDEGLEIVEEKARGELGMVRPNEILVQIAAR